jgi:hypothetical protein
VYDFVDFLPVLRCDFDSCLLEHFAQMPKIARHREHLSQSCASAHVSFAVTKRQQLRE